MNWTSIRGDLQNTGSRATSGPESDPELVWRHDAGARIFGTPLVVEDQVIVGTCAQAHNSRGCLVAIDRATGDHRWASVSDAEEVRGTPVIHDQTAWMYDLDGRVFVVDVTDGVVTDSLEHRPPTPADGVSPHVFDGRLYASRYGLDVRDATTLEVEWEPDEGYLYDEPPAFTEDRLLVGASKFTGEEVYVGTTDHGARSNVHRTDPYIQSVDPTTGEVDWEREIDGMPKAPAVSGKMLIVPTDGSEPAGFRINTITAETDEQPIPDEEPIDYSTFGTVHAFDVRSGAEQWTARLDEPVRTMPAVTDDVVCLGTRAGDVIALDVSDGTERWRYSVNDDEGLRSSPTIAGDTVYVGSEDGHLVALALADGTERWRFETGTPVHANPSVVDETLFLADNDGTVYALR